MPSTNLPAPSPTPGPRAARLAETFDHALVRTLDRVKDPSGFAACFPTIDAPDVLRVVQEQMVKLLGDKCRKEFDRIMTSRDVVAKLNQFEALVADAAARRARAGDAPPPTPPHLLSPETIIAAHSHSALDPILSSTMLRLAQRRAQNAHLVDCLAQQTAAIDALLARLDAAKLDVVAAAQALDPDNDALSCPAAPDDASNASTAATQPATSTAPTLDSAPNPPDAAGTTHAADAATS